jgi:hypothetical protein
MCALGGDPGCWVPCVDFLFTLLSPKCRWEKWGAEREVTQDQFRYRDPVESRTSTQEVKSLLPCFLFIQNENSGGWVACFLYWPAKWW